jgi:hypothetical protein
MKIPAVRLVLSFVLPGFLLPCLTASTHADEADRIPPALRIVQPAVGTEIGDDNLTVEIEYSDAGSGIAPGTLDMVIGGKDYAGRFDHHNHDDTRPTGRNDTSHRKHLAIGCSKNWFT